MRGRIHTRILAARTAVRVLHILGMPRGCRVEITVTDDEGIRPLNREYRSRDSATDVLSFPQFELSPGDYSKLRSEPDGRIFLGDVVLSLERAVEKLKTAVPCKNIQSVGTYYKSG